MMSATATSADPRQQVEELEAKIRRLDADAASAREELAARRTALGDGECTADDVVTAQSRVDVIEGTLHDLRARLAPLQQLVSADDHRAKATAAHAANLREFVRLGRDAEAHSRAYAAARQRLIESVDECANVMTAELQAGKDAARQFMTFRRRHPELQLHQIIREGVSPAWIAPLVSGASVPYAEQREAFASHVDAAVQAHFARIADHEFKPALDAILDRVDKRRPST